MGIKQIEQFSEITARLRQDSAAKDIKAGTKLW